MGLYFSIEREGIYQVASETGKRYVCAKCGSEFIVTKGGTGDLICCDQPAQIKR